VLFADLTVGTVGVTFAFCDTGGLVGVDAVAFITVATVIFKVRVGRAVGVVAAGLSFHAGALVRVKNKPFIAITAVALQVRVWGAAVVVARARCGLLGGAGRGAGGDGDAVEVVGAHGIFPLKARHALRLAFAVAFAVLLGAAKLFGVGARDGEETEGHKCQNHEAKFHERSPLKTLSLGLKQSFLDRGCRIGKLYSAGEEVFGAGTICLPGPPFSAVAWGNAP
jgi:hypothetical protein